MSAGAKPAQKFIQALLAVVLLVPSSLQAAGGTSVINTVICSTIFTPVGISTTTSTPTALAAAAISGTAQPFASLDITNNGVTVAALTVAGDGSYSASVPLSPGSNQIVAHASDSCGNSADSPTLTIVRDTAPPPPPTISAPGNGSTVSTSPVTIAGSSDPGAVIAIYRNGQLAATTTTDGGGNFSASVGLSVGNNSLYATAANGAGASGPSAPIFVTYAPPSPPPRPPTPPPYVPPGPTTTQSPPAPSIIAPSSGTVTSLLSIEVTVSAVPGATVRVYANGTEAASGVANTYGTATVTIALTPGINAVYATATNRGGTSGPSEQVQVTLKLAPPLPPQILSPTDHSTVSRPTVMVSGTAAPGLLVRILRDGRELASVTAASDGSFAVSINLNEGVNTLVAVVSNEAGQSMSRPVDVSYHKPNGGIASGTQGFGRWLTNLMGVVLGVGVLIGNGYQAILKTTADSPVLVALTLILAGAAASLTRGLVGIEELWLILAAFIRQIWGLGGRGQKISGTVINHLTRKPIPWAAISTSDGRHYALSGWSGKFRIQRGEDASSLIARHPGYSMSGPANINTSDATCVCELAPQPVLRTIGLRAVDLDLGLLGWAVLLHGWSLSLYLASYHASLITLGVAAGLSLVTLMSLRLLVIQPHLRWGEVVDGKGQAYGGLKVRLLPRGSNTEVQTTMTAPNGQYTLYASPGEYDVRVELPSGEKISTPVTIAKRPAYFGFRLAPTRLP